MAVFYLIHAALAFLIFVVVPVSLVSSIVAVAKKKWKAACYFGPAFTVTFLLYMRVGCESYCFAFPSIDTRYADGFSEKAFAQVRVGMTMEEVVNLLGTPLGGPSAQANAQWNFTEDGKCPWTDWAWLGRTIVFRDDRVAEKIARVWYD